MGMMSKRTEGTVEASAAILVLFAAMLDPRISVVLSLLALTGLAIYHFLTTRKTRP